MNMYSVFILGSGVQFKISNTITNYIYTPQLIQIPHPEEPVQRTKIRGKAVNDTSSYYLM